MTTHIAKPDVHAMVSHETVLSPRFYTTDFAALDAIDVSSVRQEWDALIAEMASDPNKRHFKREQDFAGIDQELPASIRQGRPGGP